MPFFYQEAAGAVRGLVPWTPQVGVVLGSGLGAFADRLEQPVSVPYATLPHWPPCSVAGHEGRLVLGLLAGRRIAVLSGRTHAYEGHDLAAVTFGVRVLGVLGAEVLVLTNAAGGINTSFSTGSVMVIDDHINLLGANPLVGPHDDRFGPRFPSMNDVYSSRLRTIAHAAGAARQMSLLHGVYAACLGPSYETPAEIRYLRMIGADAVGMSTTPEAIVARQMGLEVLGLSLITNMAAGVGSTSPAHAEVLAAARHASAPFIALLEDIIGRL